MAVLPARDRQLRLHCKLKATQGSSPVQSNKSNHPAQQQNSPVNPTQRSVLQHNGRHRVFQGFSFLPQNTTSVGQLKPTLP